MIRDATSGEALIQRSRFAPSTLRVNRHPALSPASGVRVEQRVYKRAG